MSPEASGPEDSGSERSRKTERPAHSFVARAGAAYDHVLAMLVVLAVAITSLAILLQVFCRYALNAPLTWPEELAVLTFGWMIFLGAALVQGSDSHIAIDTLRRRAGVRLGRTLDLVRHLAIGIAAVVLIWQGVALASRTVRLTYPAMGISRAFLYGAVPVCFALLLVNLVRSAIAPARKPEADHEEHGA
jgi:TRAP-type C4-dicarboxylate transport system permease small subunit